MRTGMWVRIVCASVLLLAVGLACEATGPQIVEPGYCVEQVYGTSLQMPNHIAVSPSGIIVVTEWWEGERVVRVHDDGSLSTYAQPSSDHHFGVVFDAANNLYVGDGPNNLWRVSPTGEVTLVAEGVFGFNLDIGPSGDVYALGGENACVQRITPAGDVSVYADGFVGASELAVCPMTEEVFVFDMLAGTIWRAVPGGAPVALATDLIHEVHSVAVGPDGTVYYGEMGHLYTVSRVDGTLTEVEWLMDICPGLGIGGFDSFGRLVLIGGQSIVRVDIDTESAEVLWRGYGHSHALGVAPEGGGIYVGSNSPLLTIPGSVVKLEPDGTETPFVDGLLAEVCGFVVKTADLGYVVSSTCDSGVWTCIIHEVDMATGAKTEYAALPTHGHTLTVDPATGFLWVLVDGISYFDASDVRHSLSPSSEGIGAESIAFTPDGTLYISGYTSDIMGMPVEGALYRVDDKDGADPSYVPIADLSTVVMCCPLGNIAGGMDGNIYWVGHGDRYTPGNERDMHMLRITPAGDVTLIGYQFPMDPFAITADPDSQDLYFTSGNGVYRAYQMPLTVVDFPDSGLETAVRDAIGKPTGDICDWDLIGLSGLNAGGRSVIDLEGIQHCTDLTELCLWNNAISDIGALAGLDNLEKLWLDNNQIDDVTALAAITGLTWLFLGGNQLTGIGALSGLTNLTELELQHNQISDASPLAGLTDLTGLYLHGNQIGNISALSGMTSLTWLALQENEVSDISALSGLTHLTELGLNSNQISDVTSLSGLTGLTSLSLGGNEIVNIGALSGLTNLVNLDLSSNQIADISPLAGLINLTTLALHWNQVSDISALSGLTGLTGLWLDKNQLSDISALSGLTDLTRLFLDDTQLSDISALSTLANLTELCLGFNQISDIGPLSGLTNLATLEMHVNQVSDVSPLAGLINLTTLDVHENRIADIGTVVSNAGIDNGDYVDIRWNHLSLTPGSQDMEDISTLLGRGVNLEYDPQHVAPDTPAVFRVGVDGSAFCDGVFYGATFATGAADIAEWVYVATPVEPGTVLELDPSRSSTYRICSTACSLLLAGVVSSAPGVTLGGASGSEPRALLALTGIVPVKVTNEGGPIRPGDLLVSSSTPGHAMRCGSQTACPCCILGKALAPMSTERGVILVLLMAP